MVAAVVISSIVFLAVDLTCRCLDIMLLQVEISLEVKVTCKEEDVDKQDGRRAGKRLLIMISMSTTLTERANHVLNSHHFGDYNVLRSLQS
jgi:hypothetical protein